MYFITHNRSWSENFLQIGFLTFNQVDWYASEVTHDLHDTGGVTGMSVGEQDFADIGLTLFNSTEKFVSIGSRIDESTYHE